MKEWGDRKVPLLKMSQDDPLYPSSKKITRWTATITTWGSPTWSRRRLSTTPNFLESESEWPSGIKNRIPIPYKLYPISYTLQPCTYWSLTLHCCNIGLVLSYFDGILDLGQLLWHLFPFLIPIPTLQFQISKNKRNNLFTFCKKKVYIVYKVWN